MFWEPHDVAVSPDGLLLAVLNLEPSLLLYYSRVE